MAIAGGQNQCVVTDLFDQKEIQMVAHLGVGNGLAGKPADPGHADRVPAAVATEILKVAATSYEYVIVDTPPSFTEHVLAAVDVSSLLVLVATLDIPAVKNLKIALDIEELPLPLRPTAYLLPSWKLSSGWTTWPLRP